MTFVISVLMSALTSFAENAAAAFERNQAVGGKAAAATSLRANGSRECAPDDRLREAIHGATRKKYGLLRLARNDDKI
jgi:hypothetical protein